MKVSGPVRLLLGFAASGGFALVLTGNALAADSTVTDNNTQATSQNETYNVSDTTVKTDDSSAVKVSVDSSDASGKGATETTPETSKPAAIISVNNTKPEAPAGQGSVAGAITATGAAVVTSANSIPPAIPEISSTVSPSVASVAKVAESPETAATSKSSAESLVIGNTILTIQPKITTTHLMAVVDLASQIPSAPVLRTGHDAPAPTQPTGVLGRLTAGLAGAVVPVIFHGSAAVPVGSAAGMGLITVIWLSLGLAALTFGAWLRRGGYAHAARSDVADRANIFTFATPLKLSYGVALGHTTAHF